MPKQKTHRASAKRFKRTGNGGLKRAHAFTSHRFHGKTKKQRRQLRIPIRRRLPGHFWIWDSSSESAVS